MKRDFIFKTLAVIVISTLSVFAQVYNNSYYDSISPLKTTFISDLENRIRNPYFRLGYDEYASTILASFEARDTLNGKKVLTCVYSGENYVYTPPFSWGSSYSREHTWCYSWMPTYGSETGNEYSDQHHLFFTNQNNANARRSNHPLGIVATVTYQYLEGKFGTDAKGAIVYEPRQSHKGDAARALLYMSVRYDGTNGNWTFDKLNNSTLPAAGEAQQDLATLLQWNNQDPPDMWEVKRNNYIESVQKNRNPFVDHPEYVNYIDFNTLTLKVPTFAVEPSNHLTNLTSSVSDSSVTFKWTKAAAGTQAPAGYFIAAYKDSNYIIPVDGYTYTEQKDLSKGEALVYAPFSGPDSIVFKGLTPATSYMFTAYSYNGSAALINYKTTGVIPHSSVKTSGKATPVAGFDLVTANVIEGLGIYNLNVSISTTTDLIADAKVTVAIKTGNNKYVGGFTSQVLTFTPNGSKTLSVPLNIPDDNLNEGTKAIVFSLTPLTTNVKTGQSEFTLNVNDNDGVSGGNETFANFPETSQSYLSNSFKGLDGSIWSYVFCSGNSAGVIDGRTPVMKKDATAKVESGIIQGGCGYLTFRYMQAFSANVDLSVFVNNVLITNVTSNSEVSKIKTTDTIKVLVPGPFTFRFQQSNATAGQVSIDDIHWSGYEVVSVKENNNIPNNFSLDQNFPNPFNPETTIGYSLPTAGHVTLKVYDVLGGLVSTLVDGFSNAGNFKIKFNGKNLSSGIYFYKLSSGNFTAGKKLILVK